MKVLIRTSMILAFLCSLPILHAQTWCALDWTLTSSSTSVASTISPSGIKLNSLGTAATNAITPILAANANGAITFRLDSWGGGIVNKPYINMKYSTPGMIYNIKIQQDSIKITSSPHSGSETTIGVKLATASGAVFRIEKNNGVLGVYRIGVSRNYVISVTMGTYANSPGSISLSMYGAAGLQISNSAKSFGCPNTVYAQLLKQPGSGYFTMPVGSTNLYFQFNQEYEPQSSIQAYAIYNDSAARLPVINGSFSVTYGKNLVNADVSSLANGMYTLEFSANKGEKYYLRFKKQ